MSENVVQGFELSPQQRRSWRLDTGGRGRARAAVELDGELDPRILVDALAALVGRHEALRTTFEVPPGMNLPLQVILPAGGARPTVTELGASAMEPDAITEFDDEAWERLFAACEAGASGVLRAAIASLAPRRHLLLLSLPSLCGDARTMLNLTRDLGRLYAAGGREGEEGEILQYADYADWHNELLHRSREDDEPTPREELEARAARAGPALPFRHPAGAAASRRRSFRLAQGPFAAPVAALETAAEALDISLDDLLLAAWLGLVGRLTRSSSVVVARLFEGRGYEELTSACGPFAKVAPIVAGGGEATPFAELARRVAVEVEQVREAQNAFIWPAGSTVAVGFEAVELLPPWRAGDLEWLPRRVAVDTEPCELCLVCRRGAEGLAAWLVYDPALYDAADVERLGRWYARSLACWVHDPGLGLGAPDLLSAAEHARRVREGDAGPTVVPSPELVHESFARHAAERPSAPALVYEERELSYGELEARANRLAHRLIELGVGPEALVGLLLERSEEVVVAMLATLKAGGAYVPLEPSQPSRRLRDVLEQVDARVLVAAGEVAPEVAATAGAVLLVDREAPDLARRPAAAPASRATPANLAYVLFTSGSTGRPKGVAVEHRQLRNYVFGVTRRLELPAGVHWATVSTFAADLGNTSIYGALTTGGCLHVVAQERIADAASLSELFARRPVDCLKIVPSHLEALLSDGKSQALLPLSCLVLGGEALRREWVLHLSEVRPGLKIVNHYGPTETTVGVLAHRVEPASLDGRCASVPLGRPLANSRVHVLDRRLRPAPVWTAGEIFVGGAGVTRGYLGRARQTAASYLPDPFTEGPGERLYRTGDLGRLLPSGVVEFAGRADEQVKYHGFRLELAEVRAALCRHPEVRDGVARLLHDAEGRDALVAFYVSRQELDAAMLRAFLAAAIPEEVLPTAFVHLRRLPLTPNGKLDTAALPGLEEIRRASARRYAPPRDATEVEVAEIWQQVLGLERVGIDEDFFELGGHSLMATRLLARVRERYGVALPLADLLAEPTVAGLAQRLARYLAGADGGRPPAAELPVLVADIEGRCEPFPLTEVQQAYWVGRSGSFELGNVSTHTYVELDSAELDLERVEDAFNRLIRHHDMLRAVVRPDGLQQVLAEVPRYRIEVEDLTRLAAEELAARLEERRRRMSHQVLRADRWPLFEIAASRLPGGRVRLHVSRDALIFDAWSSALVFNQLARLYAEPSAALPALEVTYRDYVLAEQRLRESDLYRRSWEYWRERLDHLPAAPQLPLRIQPTELERPRFRRRSARLEARRWSALQERAASSGLTASGIVAAAFGEVLTRWSKSPHFLLNLTLFQRLPLHPQIDELVGDFTALVLLEIDGSVPQSFAERARQLQRRLWNDIDHSYVNGVQILREVARRLHRPGEALAPVVLTSTLSLSLSEQDLARRAGLGELTYGVAVTSQVWLDHAVSEEAGALVLSWNAVEDLFPAGLLDDMFGSYVDLLERLASEESRWQAWRPLGLPAWQEEMLASYNATAGALAGGLLQGPFEERARERPAAPAVLAPDRDLSYGELAARSAWLAGELAASGAARNRLVAVVMHKGWEQVVAVLGIVRSGAAYLPIDASLPQARIGQLLERGGVELVVTQPEVERELEWPEGLRRWVIAPEPAGEVKPWSGCPAGPEDLAYVIFTSGSTGEPKGVAIRHRSALNTVVDINERFGVTSSDRVLGLSSLSFDLSVYDVFGVLGAGGALVIPEPAAGRDPGRWSALMAAHGVTMWNTVPALLEMLVEHSASGDPSSLASLRLALLSGDWIALDLPERLRSLVPSVEVVSLGGATEGSIWSIYHPLGEVSASWSSIPYGRPLRNQSMHVLDAALAPRPVWVPGELFIGGVGVAQGYWRDEERTAASFVTHPSSGERLYRTGDLGRMRPEGWIEFLGREDTQVKVQGYRVELGEIEAALASHPSVRAAVVQALGDPRGNRRLAAYVVAQVTAAKVPVATPCAEEKVPPLPLLGGETLRDEVSRLEFKLTEPGVRRFVSETGKVELPGPALDRALAWEYSRRRSHRAFARRGLTLDELGRLLASLRHETAVKCDPTTAGETFRVYLAVRPGRVEGLAAGIYAYDPCDHGLVTMAPGVEIGGEVLAAANRPVLAAAACAVFLVARRRAAVPRWGPAARDRCLWEAGRIGQVLMDGAMAETVGLCPVGTVRFADVRGRFAVAEEDFLAHCLLVGPLPADRAAVTPAAGGGGSVSPPDPMPEGDEPGAALLLAGPRWDDDAECISSPAAAAANEEGPGRPRVSLPAPPAVPFPRAAPVHLLEAPLTAAVCGGLLSCLRQVRLEGEALPKYRYPSAGNLYAVQAYVHVAPGRADDVPGGLYYYHPKSHALVPIATEAPVEELWSPADRERFAAAGVAILLVGRPDLAAPLYGRELGHDFCQLEAGYMARLLASEAPRWGGALLPAQPVAAERFAPLRQVLELDESSFLAALLGGGLADPQEAADAAERRRAELGPVPSTADPASPSAVTAALATALRARLPEYMVPTAWRILDALPLTATGKVDRHALLDLEATPETPTRDQGGCTPTEEILLGIFRELLDRPQLAVDADFFDLGGNSVQAIRLMSRVREAFGAEVPIRRFFAAPSVTRLAAAVEEVRAAAEGRTPPPPIEVAPRDHELLVLSFAQERQWFLAQLNRASPVFNNPASIHLHGRLDRAVLGRAVNEIVRRHESLRTTFHSTGEGLRQRVAPVAREPLPLYDLSALDPQRRTTASDAILRHLGLEPFDLSRGPLLRTALVRLAADEHVLFFVMHHIVGDYWSAVLLYRELTELYGAFVAGRPSPLPEPAIQYADFARWQRELLRGALLEEQLAYWRRQLAGERGAPPALAMPTDFPRPAVPSLRGAALALEVPLELARDLRRFSQGRQATVFMTILASFQVLLHSYCGQHDVVVGVPIAGRNQHQTEGLIGYFVNALALRADLSGNPAFEEVLRRARETTLGAYAHQDVPFEKVVEDLRPERQTSFSPLFQVVLNFRSDAPMARRELPDLVFTPQTLDTRTAKYDFTLYMWEDHGGGLSGTLEYSTDLFREATMRRLLERFTRLLWAVTTDPSVTCETLAASLNAADEEEETMQQKERERSNLARLRGIRRRSVTVSEEQLVDKGFLDDGGPLPLVVRPHSGAEVDLTAWAAASRPAIEEDLLRHGGILFRGFDVSSVADFERFARTVAPDLVNYVEGSSPRVMMSEKVYTSTEYPPEYPVSMHNELSYAHRWPRKILFFCLVEPQEGGETPIADSRRVLAELPGEVRRRFMEKGVCYLRNLHGGQGAGLSWQTVFETDDRAVIEEYCREGGVEVRWKDGGFLWTRQRRPAVISHPQTGEQVWFNQVDQWHASNLGDEVSAALAATREEERPINACHGDGSSLDPDDLEEIRRTFARVSVKFPWRQGDVLLLDNMLVAHGRAPFSGPRKVVVTMGEPVLLNDVEHYPQLAS